METRTSVFDHGPRELLHKIVQLYSSEAGVDRRLQVTVHCSGRSWTGVPTQFVNDRSGEYFVLSNHDKPQTVAISASQIVAVEVESARLLESIFSKPWTTDPNFVVISKLQAIRDLSSQWGDEKPKVNVHFDTFPGIDDAPGFALAWLSRLKAAFESIRKEFGDTELSAISTVEVKYANGAMTCAKNGDVLNFTIDMTSESLNSANISARLSDAL